MGWPARIAGVLASVGIAAMGAACGSSAPGVSGAAQPTASEPTAGALVRSMQAAVRDAGSVHVTGQLSQQGAPIGVDLNLHRDGDLAGTISQDGASANVVGVGSKTYVKATSEFLRQVKAPAGACAVVCGKWIRLSSSQAAQLTGDLSMAAMTGALTSTKVPKLTETGSTTVAGQPAWVLRAADGSTLAVSKASRHYPLQATDGGSTREVVTYSDWNAVPPVTPPPAGRILNLSGS